MPNSSALAVCLKSRVGTICLRALSTVLVRKAFPFSHCLLGSKLRDFTTLQTPGGSRPLVVSVNGAPPPHQLLRSWWDLLVFSNSAGVRTQRPELVSASPPPWHWPSHISLGFIFLINKMRGLTAFPELTGKFPSLSPHPCSQEP